MTATVATRSTTLANGLRVHVESDPMSAAVTVCVTYGVGSRHEELGRTGLAHLFEHIMFHGSRHVAPGEHDEIMFAVGGEFNAMTAREWTAYYDTIPPAALELTLWLEADRMATLGEELDQETFDIERDVVRNERRQTVDNQPYGGAYEALSDALFPDGHPYRHMPIGSMEHLAAASVEDAAEFFRCHYVPENAQVVLVGNVDPDVALEAVERYFGPVPAGRVREPRHAEVLAPLPSTQPPVVVDQEVPLPALFLGWLLPPDLDPLTDAADVAMSILCGGSSSRLVDRLCRREPVLAQMGGSVERHLGANSVAMMAGIAFPGVDLEIVAEVITDEIDRLATDGPTDDEVARVKALSERGRLEEMGSTGGRALALARAGALYGATHHADAAMERLAAVTADDVRRAARLLRLEAAQPVIYAGPNGLAIDDERPDSEGVTL